LGVWFSSLRAYLGFFILFLLLFYGMLFGVPFGFWDFDPGGFCCFIFVG